MKLMIKRFLLLAVLLPLFATLSRAQDLYDRDQPQRVIMISVDGLRPDVLATLGPKKLPNFYHMIKKGASTLNARTDHDYTITMPNHTCMLTGRPVMGPSGHHYLDNSKTEGTLHEVRGFYVQSVFDVAHDAGLRTGFFASKAKFQVYLNSYAGTKSKIDVHQITDREDEKTLHALLDALRTDPPALSFLHLAGPDTVGHKLGWASPAYFQEIENQDRLLGQLLETVQKTKSLADSTVIILTSDHGGTANSHMEPDNPLHYTVPLLIWGKGVAKKADLYKINTDSRKDPVKGRVSYDEAWQPIRNGDMGNCALKLLGLQRVPGSTIGNVDPLRIN